MTSSTKPEVHSILHCRQRRTERRRQATYNEYFVKFGGVVFQICEQTDRQTNKQTKQRGKAQRVARPACANATMYFLLTDAMLVPPSE